MTTVNDLPVHILLVHAIVVLLPLSALLLVLSTLWPAARAKLACSNAILSVLVVVLVPITTDAAVFDVYRIGDSSAQATWQGRFGTAPTPAPVRRQDRVTHGARWAHEVPRASCRARRSARCCATRTAPALGIFSSCAVSSAE